MLRYIQRSSWIYSVRGRAPKFFGYQTSLASKMIAGKYALVGIDGLNRVRNLFIRLDTIVRTIRPILLLYDWDTTKAT